MPNRLYSDDKIKFILLYLLKELEIPYDFQTISEIIVWDDSINYFVFTECFNQLVDNGSIEKMLDTDGKEVFTVSESGKLAISEVEDSLMKFVKERIMRSATRLLAFKKDGSNCSTNIVTMQGGYQLSCTLKNNRFNLLEIKMFFDNKEEAELLKMGFDKRGEQIYSTLLTLLSEDTKFMI